MRATSIFWLLLLAVPSIEAASYQKTDGTIVDPIQISPLLGGDHAYAGNNLEPGAHLVDADLHDAFLTEADLAGANLTAAVLSDTWRTDADLSNAVLLGADLHSADIMGTDANHANFQGADLTLVHAPDTNFRDADFTGATLSTLDGAGADLFGAILVNVAMDMASLNGADLQGACLTCANITLTNFRNASLFNADFEDAYYYGIHMPYGEFNWDAMGVRRMTWPDVPEACRVASVPESSSFWLFIPALCWLFLRRRP